MPRPLLLVAWLALHPGSLLFAGEGPVLVVPLDFPTLQAAADAAVDGDTIEVRAGTYAESLTLTGLTGVTVRAKGKVLIVPPAGSGLVVSACTGVVLEKLRVRGGTSHGIELSESTACAVLRCKLETPALDGIRTDGGGGHLIEQCTVKEAGRDAIALAVGALAPTNGSTVRDCKAIRPADDGVDVNGSDNVIEACTVIRPLADGYEIDATTVGADNEFLDCKVTVPALAGFYVTGAANAVRRGKVVRSGDDGISFPAGSQHVVQDCTLVKPDFDGVFVGTLVTEVTITGTRATRCADDAFDVQGDGATLTGNTALGAANNGFEIDGNDGLYDGNLAKGSKDDGFDLDGAVSGNVLANNKARGSKGFDLLDPTGGANTIEASNDFQTVGS